MYQFILNVSPISLTKGLSQVGRKINRDLNSLTFDMNL